MVETEKISPLKRFINLNASALSDLTYLEQALMTMDWDYTKEVHEHRKRNPLAPINAKLLENIREMYGIYAQENPDDDNEILEAKIKELSGKTHILSESLDIAVKLDYVKTRPARISMEGRLPHTAQHPTAKNLIDKLLPLYGHGKKHIRTSSDIECIENIVRYMHANILASRFKVDEESGKGIILKPKRSIYRDKTIDINDQTDFRTRVIDGKLTTSDPVLKPILEYFEDAVTTLSPDITMDDKELTLFAKLGYHKSSITVTKTEIGYNIDFWESGDSFYGDSRERYLSEFLGFFEFETREVSKYGIKAEKEVKEQDLSVLLKILLYTLDNTKNIDMGHVRKTPQELKTYVTHLIRLKDYKRRSKQGLFDYEEIEKRKGFTNKSKRIPDITERQRRILAQMLVSPFPSLVSKPVNGRSLTEDYGRRNPDPIGFAYFHVDDFFSGNVSPEDIFDLIIDVDLVYVKCFNYKEITNYKFIKDPKTGVETQKPIHKKLEIPYTPLQRTILKRRIDSAFRAVAQGQSTIPIEEADKVLVHVDEFKGNYNRWEKPKID